MATSINFGSDAINYETVHRESYRRLVGSSSADRAAFKENSLYLRGHHFAFGTAKRSLGDGQETASKAAFGEPGKQFFDDYMKDRAVKMAAKAVGKKANFTLGCNDDPDQYKSIHSLEICDACKIPREGAAESQKPSRRHSFNLGSDRLDYTSTAGAAHIHFKNLQRVIIPKERTLALRKSSFEFGSDAVEYESAAAAAYNAAGFGVAPHEAETGPTGAGVRGVNFKVGDSATDYNSENRRSYGGSQLEAIYAHCRNPTRLDPATKADLRMAHYQLGSDAPVYKSLAGDSFGGSLAKSRSMDDIAREKAHLEGVKKDLRATHITLGRGGPNKLEGVTNSQAAYLAPTTEILNQERKGRQAPVGSVGRAVNFTFGTDTEELRQIRGMTLQQEAMRGGLAGEGGAHDPQDMEFTKDLRKCHFYLGTGQGADQWQSTSSANYVEHRDARPTVMSAETKKDLRASHYQLGGEDGYSKDMKSTAQEQYVFFGPAPQDGSEERSNATNFVFGNSKPVYSSTASEAYSWPAGRPPPRKT